MPNGSKVWFITGTSRGFGRIWAEAALKRGDKVAATARDTASLDELSESYGDAVLPLELDVTDKVAVDTAVKDAHDRYGRLDVVVNNAGYGLFGTIEEVTEAQARAQIETNLFGALWVTKAALPYLREQGSGRIIQVSSIGGVNAFPTLGLYHASKWALEGFSQALDAEVRGLGIKVTLVEPTGYDDRLERLIVGTGGASARLRRSPRGAGEGGQHTRPAGRSRGDRRGNPEDRRRRRPAATGLSRERPTRDDPRGVRPADRHLGELERRFRTGARSFLSSELDPSLAA